MLINAAFYGERMLLSAAVAASSGPLLLYVVNPLQCTLYFPKRCLVELALGRFSCMFHAGPVCVLTCCCVCVQVTSCVTSAPSWYPCLRTTSGS